MNLDLLKTLLNNKLYIPLRINFCLPLDRPPRLQMPTINSVSPNELFIDWDNELSLTKYQISHYLVNITINSSPAIIVANRTFTNINVTPGDSVLVSVAAVDEAGRLGEYSDPGAFNNMCQ